MTTNEFVRPSSVEYPFDRACNDLAVKIASQELDTRHLRTKTDFSSMVGQYLSQISGDDFRIKFGPRHYGRITGAHEITTPLGEICVYGDNSGPTFYRYVGKNWPEDKHAFFDGMKLHSRMNRKPRTYVKYSGSHREQGKMMILPGLFLAEPKNRGLAPYLVADNDLGREYDPQNSEPRLLMTMEVMEQFDKWLQENVLAKIARKPQQA